MKTKLLYFLLATLILTNAGMLFMLITKPHQQKKAKDNFLVTTLQFDEDQIERFRLLEQDHRDKMRGMDSEIMDAKDILFNSFSKEGVFSDSIAKRIGELHGLKEKEVFAFFKQVRTICTSEQLQNFDELIQHAMHKSAPNILKKEGRRPPPPPR